MHTVAMSASVPIVVPVIAMPRLPPTVPRSGVSDVARLALRQLLGDVDRQLAEAFRAGADVNALIRARADAVERIVVHVWNACIGDAPALGAPRFGLRRALGATCPVGASSSLPPLR